MTRSVRAGALAAAAALLAVAATAGCQSGSGEPKAGTSASASSPAADAGARQPALPAEFTGQKLSWKTCPPPSAAQGSTAAPPGADWTCAKLKAPLDYAKPDGRTIELAMIRSQARDKDERIGSLLFNFGGPGGSGVSTLPGSAEIFRSLSDRYDLVSFDPRGVARSSGVVCRDDRAAAAAADLDHTPDTPAEEKAFLADARSFAAGCERRSGAVLPHVGTEDAARDLDLMRQVLGDDKLHYFGFSYGTELGGTYAHLFPGKVGRVVLDAVVDPSADDVKHALNQATGFQRALENYLADCAREGASCPTGTDPDAGVKKITGLLEQLDEKPLPTSDNGRKLTENQALTGIVMSLYNESSWQYLTQGLREAFESGTGDLLLSLADQYNERGEDGSYGTQSHAQRAISCADSTSRLTAAEAKKNLPEFREVSPVFGAFLSWDTAGWCADWPVRGAAENPGVSAEGAAPILVVGTTGDPATPYEGARIMADELGEDVGVHLTYKGEGHGAYMTGNPCTQRTIDAYLLEGKVPEDGKTCT